jgi:hypothetical protein
MKKEELIEWGYPIHPESDYSKPLEGDFGTWLTNFSFRCDEFGSSKTWRNNMIPKNQK